MINRHKVKKETKIAAIQLATQFATQLNNAKINRLVNIALELLNLRTQNRNTIRIKNLNNINNAEFQWLLRSKSNLLAKGIMNRPPPRLLTARRRPNTPSRYPGSN
jgi:hypothetical protein